MANPWATFEDVNSAFEDTIDPERQDWVEELIGRAQRKLAAKMPSIQRRLDDETLDPQNVSDAIVEAVLRVVRNPKGIGSEMEGNYQISVARDVASGKLYFTGDDLMLLRPPLSGLPGSIKLGLPCARRHP